MIGCRFLPVTLLAVLCACVYPTRTYIYIANVTTAAVSTDAGVADSTGVPDGYARGTQALFNGPEGLAIDSDGNMYVADAYNATIRKITPAGDVTTIAGQAGVQGATNGPGAQATFRFPKNVALFGSDYLLVADSFSGNSLIRQISLTDGHYTVTTLDCVFGGPPNDHFNDTHGIAFDGPETIYVADYGQGVWKLTKDGSQWDVTTYCTFSGARSLAFGPDGNVYAANSLDGRIMKITGPEAYDYLKDGGGTALSFDNVWGVAFDAVGNLYASTNQIIKVSTTGVVTTLAGTTTGTAVDGWGTSATFESVSGLAFGPDRNLYATDIGNSLVRKLSSSVGFDNTSASSSNTLVTTYAGGTSHAATNPAPTTADGKRQLARFSFPTGLAADASGNVYVASGGNGTDGSSIAKISPSGLVTLLAFAPDVVNPQGIALGSDGNLYVANAGGTNIRRLTSTDGFSSLFNTTVDTFSPWSGWVPLGIASDGAGGFFVSSYAAPNRVYKVTSTAVTPIADVAAVSYPTGLAFDSANKTLYAADANIQKVYKITSSDQFGSLSGTIVTPLKNAATGADAVFTNPISIALDGSGGIYVACFGGNTVNRITSAGEISIVAGSGAPAESDGIGTAAQMNGPWGVAYVSGSLRVTDNYAHTVRKVTVTTKPLF